MTRRAWSERYFEKVQRISRNGRLREDGLRVHDFLLAQVKSPEESKGAWDYYKVPAHINDDEAFGPPNPACAIVKK